jgi:galactokinase
MHNKNTIISELKSGRKNEQLARIYACDKINAQKYADRYIEAICSFEKQFGENDEVSLFSAPGRTEIGGNHTDHQHGCVLAASVNLDVIAVAAMNDTDTVRIKSEGYDIDEVSLNDLAVQNSEKNRSISLIRGVCAKITSMGYKLRGFDAYTTSNVLKGSGLSSSAAFEVLVGTIINGLFCNNKLSPVEIAQIGQYAENEYFGKPSGLMDQMASSVGSAVAIDFADTQNPKIERVDFDFSKCGYKLCIIDSGADHADLTDEYAAITTEMRQIANFFGKDYLREVDMNDFLCRIAELRKYTKNDRAVLRAMHFFNENIRACDEYTALMDNDFERFLDLLKKSGYSSYMYLQNVYASSKPEQQAVSIALAVCDDVLKSNGAYRVHGGGFAGTVQAFVPDSMTEEFKTKIENVLGKDMCHILSIRPVGGVEI